MTKKDFILIADALKRSRYEINRKFGGQGIDWNAFILVLNNLEEALKSDNPKFNKEKFDYAVLAD